ncbi:hypothetical protein B0H17DRAFT_1199436 [Mycena rosella]|uniref:Histone H1 n=1 Tax=Mycena rosella TaxID=1033263 RepID=A0AAD7DP43_MYCRO|nr:hypothetical protein B0H17DRAFT_1199436 [Mycena rosella]
MSSNTSASPAPVSAAAPNSGSPVATKATKKAPKKAPKKATPKFAAPKAKKAAASKAAPAHPPWKEIIQEGITTSDAPTRLGVSRIAIKKYANDMYQLFTPAHISQLNRAIAAGVEAGLFILPKGPSGCIKLAPKVRAEASKENSKPASKTPKTAAPKAKPAPAKKAASKSKSSTAVVAKKAVVGKKAAPSTKAKAAPKKAAAKPRSAPKKKAAA